MEDFDLTVIGAGPGGYVAAVRAAQRGLRTVIIENREVGGTCLNRGCVPTKSLLHGAHLYKQAIESEIFGVTAEASFDFTKMNGRKNDVVRLLRAGTERLLKSNGVKIIYGRAAITGANRIEAETADGDNHVINTKNIIIATGSKPNRLPEVMRGIENVITSDEALAPDARLYNRLVIIGGGVIGVEFANMYSDLGREVTVIDSMENLLNRSDIEISKNLMKLFVKRGIKVFTPAFLQSIEKTGGGLLCKITHRNTEKEIEADGVLVCVGRAPLTDGVPDFINHDERGFILTDGFMRTNIPNIYAVGDCVSGGVQLAHAASAQGLNAVAHIIGESPAVNVDVIPSCVYTNPEIASVGLTAAEAEAKNIGIKTSRYLMNGNGKSIITKEERGLIKLVFDARTEILIGAHLMCARAADIIGELANAVANKQTARQLASIIRPHPTYVEGITEAAEGFFTI